MRIIFCSKAYDPIAKKCIEKILTLSNVEIVCAVLAGHINKNQSKWDLLCGNGFVWFFQKTVRLAYLRFRCEFRRFDWRYLDRILGSPLSVFEIALKHHLPILNYVDLDDDRTRITLLESNPDLLITCTFPLILKKNVLEIPKFGGINIHPSLLPRYRGPSPIFWVLFNRERYTGVTIHKLNEKCDEGDILFQERIEINSHDDLDSLTKKVASISADLLEYVFTEERILTMSPLPQNPWEASYQARPNVTQMREIRVRSCNSHKA
ncbi:MAG: methionyl-tRNA formyltransferase [Candidatus Hodarchaeota archaeon]